MVRCLKMQCSILYGATVRTLRGWLLSWLPVYEDLGIQDSPPSSGCGHHLHCLPSWNTSSRLRIYSNQKMVRGRTGPQLESQHMIMPTKHQSIDTRRLALGPGAASRLSMITPYVESHDAKSPGSGDTLICC